MATFGKRYLGDGVYVNCDGRGIWLTAENGIEATDRIFLEPEVLAAFMAYLADLQRAPREPPAEHHADADEGYLDE